MVSSVETAKKILEDEVKNAPYTNDDPFSNATSFRKIIEYIYLCVVDENVSREEAFMTYIKINQSMIMQSFVLG